MILFFFSIDKPPVFGPCKLLDFELEMVGERFSVNIRNMCSSSV